MELAIAKMFVIISLMLSFTSCYCSSIERRVPKGSDPVKSPPTQVSRKQLSNIDKLYEYDIKRRVPDGPNEQQPPPTPVSNIEKLYEFNIKRRVPDSPDEQQCNPVVVTLF
ncbi:hypothetical protein P3S68_016129 [Capsicum galapagoense]